MNLFNWQRFLRALQNDLQQQWRKVWVTTLGLVGLGLIIYFTNIDSTQVAQPDFSTWLFPLALVVGGLGFTSTIFADTHHPLQRFHYLTLPYSNLERFISRYLHTGPLFCLYVIVSYVIFDRLAAGLSELLWGNSAMPFSPFRQQEVWTMLNYFLLHSVMLTGAIHFRSWHLSKTLLTGTLFGIGAVFVQVASVKLLFHDYFDSLFSFEERAPSPALLRDRIEIQIVFWFLLHLWMLYLAWRCLCEHEVQDEL